MSSQADRAAAVEAVQALRKPVAPGDVTTFKGTIEFRHKAGIVMVYGGKKALSLGLTCLMRVALPAGTLIPLPERLAKLGGLDISIQNDKVRWACNWMNQFVQRDWTQPPTRQEAAQIALARYIMIGLREEEEARSRKRLKKEIADFDYDAEWKKYVREMKASRPKKAKRKSKKEKQAAADRRIKKKDKKRSKRK